MQNQEQQTKKNESNESRADELLNKLRLLKYQKLLQREEKKVVINKKKKFTLFQLQNNSNKGNNSWRVSGSVELTQQEQDEIQQFAQKTQEFSIDLVEEQDQELEQELLTKVTTNQKQLEQSLDLDENSEDKKIIDFNFNVKQIQNERQEFIQIKRQDKRKLTSQTLGHSQDKEQNVSLHHSYGIQDQQKINKIKQNQQEVQLTTHDIDDLIKILTGQKEQIYLPNFLRSLKSFGSAINIPIKVQAEDISPEAKLFILDHFTEKEFNYTNRKDEILEINQQDSWDIIREKTSEFKTDFNFNFFTLDQPIGGINLQEYQNLSNSPSNTQKSSIFMEYCTFIFMQFGIFKTLKISSHKITSEFFRLIEACYLDNSYHNYKHAMDVTNSTAFILECGLANYMSEFEVACLLISCMAHDLGHPGFNNNFMVTTKSRQAMIYNDQSVLENYHSSLLFHILQDSRSNIVQGLDDVAWKGFRKYCMTLILDTDLQKHFQLLSKFKNTLALEDFNLGEEQTKLLLMSISIKSADVGHGAKTLELHKVWSRRIIEEFFQQGDIERKINIPVTPMCDRQLSITKSQEGFLKAIVLPLYESLNEFMKSVRFEQICLNQIKINIEYWQKQQQEEEQQTGKTQFFDDTSMVLFEILQNPIKEQDILKQLNMIIQF